MTHKKSFHNPNHTKLSDTIEEIRQQNINLVDQLTKIKELYLEKISSDELKNKQFEIMVEELQRYKNNFIFDTFQKRVYMELIGIHDRVEELLKMGEKDLSKEDILQHLLSFKKQIEQALKNQGVEMIELKENRFDPKYQEAVDVVNTDVGEEDQMVAEFIKKGFIFDNKKILRPQKIVVKRYANQTKKED